MIGENRRVRRRKVEDFALFPLPSLGEHRHGANGQRAITL